VSEANLSDSVIGLLLLQGSLQTMSDDDDGWLDAGCAVAESIREKLIDPGTRPSASSHRVLRTP